MLLSVQKTGAEVVNATDFVKEPFKFPQWEPPDDPQFSPPKTIQDDPDYHENPVYEFNPECRLLEGIRNFITLHWLLTRAKVVYKFNVQLAVLQVL